jgi:hypothetical protein
MIRDQYRGLLLIGFASFALAMLPGCAAEGLASGRPLGASYLGGPQGAAPALQDRSVARVSASKVLSAIVFERVTGREVDPARLVDR